MGVRRKHRATKTKNTVASKILPLVFFVFGILIASYPIVSQLYYQYKAGEVTADFDVAVMRLKDEDIEERFKLADAFNSTLKPALLRDPFTPQEKKAGVDEYATMLKVNEMIGHVEIPKINQDLPIYVGSSEFVLQKGAGLLEGTSLPIGGEYTHTVLTAHRGLPTAKLFTDLDKMAKGDIFYLHVLNRVLAYEVDQVLIVEPNDFEPILIQKGGDYATLLTCTPYMINTHRLLVRGKRIPYTAPIKERHLTVQKVSHRWFILLLISILMILVLSYRVYVNKKIVRTQNKQLERLSDGD